MDAQGLRGDGFKANSLLNPFPFFSYTKCCTEQSGDAENGARLKSRLTGAAGRSVQMI